MANVMAKMPKSAAKLRTISLLMGAVLYSSVLSAQDSVLDVRLSAQPLQQAVDTLARQSNVQILYVSDLLKDKKAVALNGKLTVQQALQQLLRGTSLTIQRNGDVLMIVEQTKTASTLNYANLPYQMPAVVVTAQNSDDSAQFGQSVFNQQAIERYQPNNVAQLLDNMPGVSSGGSPRPGGQTINILGMGAVEDVPITVDGSLKLFDKYRQGSVFIEPEILKVATVDKGPHNVEVGNGGFGGKVTLETKDAKDFLKDDQQVGGFLKLSHFSNNNQNTYSGAVFTRTKDGMADGLFYYTKRDNDNVKRPDGSRFLYSAQVQDTYLAKLNFFPADAHSISVSAMQSGHDGWEPFAAMRDQDAVPSARDIELYGYDEAWKRRLVYRDQEDTSYSTTYEYTPDDNPYINLKAVASYSKTKQHDQRHPDVTTLASLLGNESWVTYTNTTLKLSNISHIDTDYGSHRIKVGAHYQKMKQISVIFDKGNASKEEYNFGYYEPNYMPAGDQQMYSAFIEDQYQIYNVTITPSLRYDHITNQGYGNQAPRYNDPAAGHDYSDKTYAGWSPRLALAWQQTDNLSWFANISRTWRAPRVDEQYYVQSATTTVPETSRYLLPEKVFSLRLGNQMDFSQLLTDNDHLQVRLTYYRNRGQNEIFRNRSVFCAAQAEIIAGGGSANSGVCNDDYFKGFYRNLTSYTINGYEAEAFYNQSYYFAGLTYSYVRGQRDNSPVNPWFSQKTWIEEVPPRKATATLGVNVPQYDLSIGWRGIFVDAQDRSILNTDNSVGASGFSLPRTSGYALHNIFADWKPLQDKSLSINFGIDNLFNRDYKMYLGEYMTGTGRDYKVSVSYQF